MRSKAPALLLVGAVFLGLVGAAGVSAAGGSSAFPASLYPAPVPAAAGHGLSLCPSSAGLAPFTAAVTRIARGDAATFHQKSLATDLRNADRAWWTPARRIWASGPPQKAAEPQVVLGSSPAAKSQYAVFVRPACGAATLATSLMVTVGPRQPATGPHCVACNTHLFYVNRRGRPLLYYAY